MFPRAFGSQYGAPVAMMRRLRHDPKDVLSDLIRCTLRGRRQVVASDDRDRLGQCLAHCFGTLRPVRDVQTVGDALLDVNRPQELERQLYRFKRITDGGLVRLRVWTGRLRYE
jgi:hypothetical protein